MMLELFSYLIVEDLEDLFPWFWLFNLWSFKFNIQFVKTLVILYLQQKITHTMLNIYLLVTAK